MRRVVSWQKDEFVEIEKIDQPLRHSQMPAMNRIERATVESDSF
jgi:hypothetical protein